MNITPQQVIETIVAAGVKQWVLMGLYGYVGYLAQPRATQDVDVMVHPDEKEAAVAAVMARWPRLKMRDESPIVVRFADPGEMHSGQPPQVVIDIRLASDKCQFAILKEHIVVDPATGHRLPTLEAALASKYSAIVSLYRKWDRKQQDAVDFRSIVMPTPDCVDRDAAFELGELIFAGGGTELLEFIQLAIDQKPFPV